MGLSKEIELVIEVQIQNEVVCISFGANVLRFFGLVSLFNRISNLVDYSMQKQFLSKNSNDTT